MSEGRKGPLAGVQVVEMAGLGPTPFAAMWFADMGADVVRIERPGLKPLIPMRHDILNRGRGHVVLNLKSSPDREKARALIDRADMLIEGMRPGVMERLGLGPETFSNTNPTLIYGRMTGWGQHGPLAQTAGHDINYIGLTGALHAIGPAEGPVPPLNLVGDFGGGAMYLVAGMLAALHAARISGHGQVVDCAITDGTAHLMAMIYGMHMSGVWEDQRASNLLDGAAPFYRTYQCACGGAMAVGALEPQFYEELVKRLGLNRKALPDRNDRENWPELTRIFATRFLEKTRDEWASLLERTDACATPVLALSEAPLHGHNRARRTFCEMSGGFAPEAAPQLERTPGAAETAPIPACEDIGDILARWGKRVGQARPAHDPDGFTPS